MDTKGELTVFRENSHGANGLLVDPQGRLVACEGALGGEPPRITRTDLRTGTIEILADGYEGMPFKGTNNVTIDNKGRLHFTDPVGAALYRGARHPVPERPADLAGRQDALRHRVRQPVVRAAHDPCVRSAARRDGEPRANPFRFRRPWRGRRQRRRPGKPLHRSA